MGAIRQNNIKVTFFLKVNCIIINNSLKKVEFLNVFICILT